MNLKRVEQKGLFILVYYQCKLGGKRDTRAQEASREYVFVTEL